MAGKKLEYIDGLKGFGALVVYLCHFVYAFYYGAYSLNPEHVHTANGIELTIGKTPMNLFYSGNFAVCLFLVMSGFVLCLSYFKTMDRNKLKIGATKRYVRLILPIVVTNILIFILMTLGFYKNSEVAQITGSMDWYYGFNSFAPNFFGMLYESFIGCFLRGSNDYNGVLWTIPYLFLGAFVVYLAAFLVGENPFRYVAYGVMLFVSVKTDVYFAGIFMGFILCDLYCTKKVWLEFYQRTKIGPMAVFILGFYLSSYPSIGNQEAMAGTIYQFLPAHMAVTWHLIGAAMMLAGVLGSKSLQNFFRIKPLSYLGKISYSLYLLHFCVIATISSWGFLQLYPIIGYHGSVIFIFSITTILVVALSSMSQKYIEPLGDRLQEKIIEGIEWKRND